jgi:hypothetical protein
VTDKRELETKFKIDIDPKSDNIVLEFYAPNLVEINGSIDVKQVNIEFN